MSKKNKTKFKKQIKNQVLQEMTKTQSIQTSNNQVAQSVVSSNAQTRQNTVAPTLEIQNLPQIKADLKKTGIVVAALALCILALALLDQKYHILTTFGSWLFKVLNIN